MYHVKQNNLSALFYRMKAIIKNKHHVSENTHKNGFSIGEAFFIGIFLLLNG
jgi:hypothetical protein